MPPDRTAILGTVAIKRRPSVSATVQRSATATAQTPARTLQERLGNHGAQVFIAGSVQQPLATSAPSPARALQRKPSVSSPDDPLERQADHVASRVLRLPEQAVAQRACGECEEEKDGPLIQRVSSAGPVGGMEVSAAVRATQRSGTALPADVRSFFEPRFGHDFSDVRLHTDDEAARAARGVEARAYTIGRDVVFGAHQYSPGSAEGRRLLAHELTHVVQQGPAGVPVVQRQEAEEVAGFTPEEVAEYADEQRPPQETGDAARAVTGSGSGVAINRPGVVACTAKSPDKQYLRKAPIPDAGDNVELTLSFNDVVFVDQRGGAGDSWLQVTTVNGKQGWVPAIAIALDPPEPTAVLYRVVVGDTPIDLAGRWYGSFDLVTMMAGNNAGDARFYVGALAFANQGRAGMPRPGDLTDLSAWKSVSLVAGNVIWRPSRAFLNTLKGKVSSGSITTEIWETVKSAGSKLYEWAVYAAGFVAGILYGAGESIYDLFAGIVDLIVMLYEVAKSLLTGNLLSDAAGLWEDLKKLKLSDLETAFLSKWNAPDPWDQAFFRGRVLGYIVMEILMLVFSGGIATVLKAAGKFAKIGSLVAKLPRIAKLAEAAKAVKVPEKLAAALKLRLAGKVGEGTKIVTGIKKGKVAVDAVLKSAEHLAKRETAWLKYRGTKTKAAWEKIYDTLTRNRLTGKLAEEQFQLVKGGATKTYHVTVNGKAATRIVDNVIGNVGREIKSGPLHLTPFIKEQILKDIELMRSAGLKVEWHLLAGGDADALVALHKAGITTIIY